MVNVWIYVEWVIGCMKDFYIMKVELFLDMFDMFDYIVIVIVVFVNL